MYQYAVACAMGGQEAEQAQQFVQAHHLYTQSIQRSEQLVQHYPGSTSALKLKNHPYLGSMSISSIKSARLPRLRQYLLITSGVLGWAQDTIERIAGRANQTPQLLHLAEIYAALGETQKAKDVLNGIKGDDLMRARVSLLKRLSVDAHHEPQSLIWSPVWFAGCALGPGVCHVLYNSQPWYVLAPLMPPIGHQRGESKREAITRQHRVLLNANNTIGAMRHAMMIGDEHTRLDLLLDIARHAHRHKDQRTTQQSLSLFAFSVNKVATPRGRLQGLLRLYGFYAKTTQDATEAIQVLKQIHQRATDIKDPVLRMEALAEVAHGLAAHRAFVMSKAILGRVVRELKRHQFTQKQQKQRERIYRRVSSAYTQQENFEDAWLWHQKLSRVQQDQPLEYRILDGLVRNGKAPNMTLLLKRAKPDAVLHLARVYAKLGERKQSLVMVSAVKKWISRIEKNNAARWYDLEGYRTGLIEVYGSLNMRREATTLLARKFAWAKKIPDNSHSDHYTRLQALSGLLKLAIEQNHVRIYNEVFKALHGDIRPSRQMSEVAHHLEPALVAYLESRRYDEMLKLIEKVPRKSDRSRAVGQIARLYMRMDSRDPKLPPKLLAYVGSYARSSEDANASFEALTALCADPKNKCLDQLAQMAKTLDVSSTKKQASRALSRHMADGGHFKHAMLLTSQLQGKDKVRALSAIAMSWGQQHASRKQYPNILNDIRRQSTHLPKPERATLYGAMVQSFASAKQCKQALLFLDKSNEMPEASQLRRVSEQAQHAALVCMIHGDIVHALKIAANIRVPYHKAQALLALGYYIDGVGHAKHPMVQRLLKSIALDAYSKAR